MTERDAELRMLQARAYGRTPDIGDDPAALRRLEALEAGVDSARDTEVGAESVPAPPIVESAPDSTTTRPGSPGDRRDAEVPAPLTWRARFRAWFSPRPTTPWLILSTACVVLACVLTGVFVVAIRSEPGVIATLRVDPGAEWPAALGEQSDDAVLFDEFYGLTLVRSREWVSSVNVDQRCMMAIRTDDLRSADDGFGSVGFGCSAGSFPASVTFTVGLEMPAEMRAAFPPDTALKFTMLGDRIEVRSDR